MMNYIKVLEITCASVPSVCVSQGSRGIGNLLCRHTYQRYVLSFCLGSAMHNISSRNSLKTVKTLCQTGQQISRQCSCDILICILHIHDRNTGNCGFKMKHAFYGNSWPMSGEQFCLCRHSGIRCFVVSHVCAYV